MKLQDSLDESIYSFIITPWFRSHPLILGLLDTLLFGTNDEKESTFEGKLIAADFALFLLSFAIEFRIRYWSKTR